MRLALLLAATLAAAGPAPLTFDDPAAQAHWDKAQDAFGSGDYGLAQEELAAAHAIEPSPRLRYAWAQAARNAGDFAEAAKLYQAFLDSDPPKRAFAAQFALYCRARAAEEDRRCREADQLYSQYLRDYPKGPSATEVVDRVGKCVPEPDAEPPLPPVELPRTDPDPLPPEDSPILDDPPPPGRPWHRDPLGGVALALGLAAAGTGAGLLGGAAFDYRNAPLQMTHDGARKRETRAIRMQTAGYVVLGVGAAVLVTAIIRYALVARRLKRARGQQNSRP